MSQKKKDATTLELDDILSEPITNSQKLAAFLQRKAAEAQKPKNGLVFGNFSFDMDFDVPLIKKPQKATPENKLKPLKELGNAKGAEPAASDVAQSPSNLASHENLPPCPGRLSPSPTNRRPPRRSGTGGHVPGSDKLRRHAIHRRSQSCGRRQLLQDFDDAANLTRSSSSPFPFVPEISSTPNCNEKALDSQPQRQSASEPKQMNVPALGSDFAAEIAEMCGQRIALFQNSMMQMSQRGEVPSSRPGSRPSTPSVSHRTYTIEKRTEQLPQSVSSPKIAHSIKPVVRVRRLETSLAPDTPNSLNQSERESAPVEDYFVPETQPYQSQQSHQSQQLVEIVHNLSRNGSVVVIPIGGAFSPKPDAAGPLPQPQLPAASPTGAAGTAASPTVSAGTPKSMAPTVSGGTPKLFSTKVSSVTPKSSTPKTVFHNKTPQVVEALDAIMTDDESDEPPSGCALNLAPAGGNTTRQSRMRKRNNRKPSDDQESSIKLLNLHRPNASSKSKPKGATAPTLNKAPSAPINGERYAKELERMSNYEILDLRKRNSLGRVNPLNGNRNYSAQQQEILEQNIQRELMRRNLENETEIEALSSTVSPERNEVAYLEEAMAMPPPAPVAFKDDSQRESRRQSKEGQKRLSRSRRREVTMTAELVNYMAISKTMELRRKSSRNSSKRSLYTKGDSDGEVVGAVSPEKQPRLHSTIQEPTPGGARNMRSHCVVEEEIAIVPPPPRSLRYSQCLRDIRRNTRSDFDEATPQDFDDREIPLSQSKGLKNILDKIAPPPLEYNDDVDGVDVHGRSSFSVSDDAQCLLSKSRVRNDRTEARAEFDDQSHRTPNGNEQKRKRPEANPRSPETNDSTEMHETVLPCTSKNKNRRLSRVATQQDDIVKPPENFIADGERTTDQRSEQREVITPSLPDDTSVADDQPSTSRAALEALARRTNEHEPELEARILVDEEVVKEVVEEVVFKKPVARAPRAKSKAKRELNNLKVSYIHDEVEVDEHESSIRRSRRGQVPLKNTWCHTVSDPRQFDFFCKSEDIYKKKMAKPSSKKSSMPRRTKISLLNRPPLCSSTPRLSGEPLHAVIETVEPPQPSECSSLGVAPLRWDDNERTEQVEKNDVVKATKKRGRPKKTSQAVEMATESEPAAAGLVPPPPVPKKKERRNKEQSKQQPVTETETETAPDPDPITPINLDSGASIPPTPSPSMSNDHHAASMQLMNWLRGYSSNQPTVSMEDCSGSRIGKTVSVVGNLVFTNLDDIEYAFYDTKDKATVGYMRFQPLQSRQKKRAKGFSLKFVVLFGQFAMDCSVPDVEEDDRCTLNIGDMVEIEKGTRYGIQNLLDEVSVLMVIRN